MTEANRKAGGLADALPTDALRDAGSRLLGLLVQRAAQVATERVGDLSERLTDYAEDGGQGLRAALTGRAPDEGRASGDGASSEEDSDGGGLLSGLKEKVKGLFGAGRKPGGGKKLKVTNIVETIDVGLPLRTTYNLWSQYQDFPSFMKKVENVDRPADETSNWKAQIFLSHRSWEATTVEQVPDSHIVWRSKGAKGHVDGAVTFTELGPNLTRVALVMEYWPQGLFEHTGNLWRAQGRRARLEFKHFRRHAMTNVILHQEDVEGWRGEIRDGEVVKTHEEALKEEQEREAQHEFENGQEDAGGPERAEAEGAEEGAEVEGAAAEDEEESDGAEDEYEPDADEYDADADEDEADYEDEDYEDEADYGDEDYEDEEPGADGGPQRRTRERAGAGSGRRR
ncbi:SRPBCC family protein [Pseudonocardia acidicola]|uniref:SRPBCC family protein n=1 Tax=Pseudonocardia acidicola TaxID=2724939 RepID=A0ABX1S543_9PSEU|nr:SRPBCC family protein [Pseudonocardia acidicola]NMH96210.1 SRPBCC family protein [Pseudonocardia acidicola]